MIAEQIRGSLDVGPGWGSSPAPCPSCSVGLSLNLPLQRMGMGDSPCMCSCLHLVSTLLLGFFVHFKPRVGFTSFSAFLRRTCSVLAGGQRVV